MACVSACSLEVAIRADPAKKAASFANNSEKMRKGLLKTPM